MAGLSLMLAMSSFADLTNRYVVKGNPGALIPYDTLARAAGDIQTAINYAYAGETVLVAAATYDTGGSTVAGRFLTNRVFISKALTLQSLNNDPANTIIKGAWDPVATNGWLAVRCVRMVAGSSLIGFTLLNGATLSSNEVDRSTIRDDATGGGVYVGANPAYISNCIFAYNSAYGDTTQSAQGGGGACNGSYFNCTFYNNTTPYRGGAADTAVLSNCTLYANTAGYAGGSHRGTLYGCLISNNTATAANGYGGGVMGWSTAVPCRMYDCVVYSNTAWNGGGVGDSTILSNCTVMFNRALNSGGGVQASTAFNCAIISNTSPGFASGAGSSILSNCVLIGNGTFYGSYYNCLIMGSQTLLYGNNSTYFVNCTITGCRHIYADSPAYIPMINCISWSNRYPDVRVMATNCCGLAGDQNNYTNSLVGNITNNPLFITDGNDYGTNLTIGNYRLQTNSPCVDSGMYKAWMAGAVDLDGLPRILKGAVDMGAYEEAHVFSYSPSAITNTVMRGYETNMTVYLTNSSPDLALYWGSSITSLWASGPNSGAPLAAPGSGTLTVTNDSYGMALGTFVSRMIVSALTNYPLAMARYSQTGAVDMVLHVAEFARNPTQVVATVRQFGHTNRTLTIWNSGSG
ncbi:MAG: choice-of-anchor Q domain-containing protein, partial [Kiritimatiellia bacterium]